MYVYQKAAGRKLPHKANSQQKYGKAVSKSSKKPGDLIIFRSGSYGYHAGDLRRRRLHVRLAALGSTGLQAQDVQQELRRAPSRLTLACTTDEWGVTRVPGHAPPSSWVSSIFLPDGRPELLRRPFCADFRARLGVMSETGREIDRSALHFDVQTL